MAMAGLVGAEMKVVDGMHTGQSQDGLIAYIGRYRSTLRARGENTDETNHAAFQMCGS